MRANTNKLLELIEDGLVDKDYIINAALDALSDDDVGLMCHNNEIFLFATACNECGETFNYEDEVNEDGLCEVCQAAIDALATEEAACDIEAEELFGDIDDWNYVGSRHHY